MTPAEILDSITQDYEGTLVTVAWGESSVFYNPNQSLPRGVYFVTVKEKDGDNDRASNLNRNDVFRLNIGSSKEQYAKHFGPLPGRPAKGNTIDGNWDFTAIDKLTPHPVYGWMGWVSINNPTRETFQNLRPLFDAAYNKAVTGFQKRISR